MEKSGDNVIDVDDATQNTKRYVEEQGFLIDGSERRAEHVVTALKSGIFLIQACDDHEMSMAILERVAQIISQIWHVQVRAALGFKEHDMWFWDMVVKELYPHTINAIYGEGANPPDNPGNKVVLQIKPSNRVEYFILRIPA